MIEPSEQMAYTLRRIAAIESRLKRFELGEGNKAPATQSFATAVESALLPTDARQGEDPALREIINNAATTYGIRPKLLQSVIQTESNFNPRAVSPAGAMGLMQLMPGTASTLGVHDPFDATENVMAGANYLRQQLDRFSGDERLALAAYNAGPGAVLHYKGVPPYAETQRYISRVLSLADTDRE